MKTLGQIAYETHCEALGMKCPEHFEKLPAIMQTAWNETAVVIQYAHRFMTPVDEPGKSSTRRVVTEHVDGGGIGARGGMATNVEKDGTG